MKGVMLSLFFVILLSNIVGCGTTSFESSSTPKSKVEVFGDKSNPQKALVIGNSDYEHGKLVNPTNDADRMADVLQKMNFYVVKAKNLTFDEMNNVTSSFENTLRNYHTEDDIALFYFSGHGAGSGVSQENYLFSIDNGDINSEFELSDKAVSTSGLLASMTNANPDGVSLMILDACRNDPYRNSSRSRTRGMLSLPSVSGTMKAYSTRYGKIADDNIDRGNSLYTRYLSDALEVAKDKPIGIERLLIKVGEWVARDSNSKQRPTYNNGIKGGEVCLGFRACKQPF